MVAIVLLSGPVRGSSWQEEQGLQLVTGDQDELGTGLWPHYEMGLAQQDQDGMTRARPASRRRRKFG